MFLSSFSLSHAQVKIDIAEPNFPPRFTGYDCGQIASRLAALKPQKDEFESTEQFQDRLDALLASPIYGAVTGIDPLILAKRLEPSQVTYDADRHVMSVSFGNLSNSFALQPKAAVFIPGTIIKAERPTTREYAATNGYGARVNVTELRREVCGAGFTNLKAFSISKVNFQTSFEVPTEEARTLKERLSLAFVGTLTAPYVGKYFNSISPTFNSPTSLIETGPAVAMRLDEVRVFDSATGRVYSAVRVDAK
ncbi:hypothetical protein [Pseudacidovorax sp. NFM-22]|uniref:hypothetical protein n=1 Tax=Pseudacidovorax sp. NFM-22 TaxID=2744469 RepID=UPI001F18FC69|nr:hypothetical protein [Pseudacidovorax sp. NFM-22]